MHHRLRTSLIVVVAATLAFAAACGGDGDEGGSDDETATATATTTATPSTGGEATSTATQAATSTGGETLDVFALNVGECFDDPPNVGAGTQVQELAGIPCDQPHDNEVYALVDYPGGSSEPYPGDAAVIAFMEEECLSAFADYVGADYETSNLDIGNLRPTAESWAQGDREVVCFLFDASLEPLTESAEGSGGQIGSGAPGGGTSGSAGQFDVFNTSVGECFNDSDLALVDCAAPHDNEVFAIFPYDGPETAYPGDEAVSAFAEEGCTVEFESYVGIDYESSRYAVNFGYPSADTWGEGDREVVCVLYDANLAQLTGSAQGTAE